MKASELRIGTNVKYTGNYPFTGIFDEQFARYMFDVNDEWELLSGILLTPEILKNFGFKLECGSYEKEGIRIFPHYEKDGKYILEGQSQTIGKGFNYIHQLQNLYFALTGEELIYTP